MTPPNQRLSQAVASATKLPKSSVEAVLRLLDDGATVPFIARYRKEATGSLDEVQIRAVAEGRDRINELEARRASIRAAIEEQGKLTPKLEQAIAAAASRTALEDLYLPYKRKKTTKAEIARGRGLSPLAQLILRQPEATDSPRQEAARYISDEVPDSEAALSGAKDILAEQIAELSELRSALRWVYVSSGTLTATLVRGINAETSQFADYDGFSESARSIRSHRYLALARGEKEKALRVKVEVDKKRVEDTLYSKVQINPRSPWSSILKEALHESHRRLIGPSLERELRGELETRAHLEAAKVFAQNLEELLLAAPFGAKPVLGVDPGLRTGSKCAMVGATGALMAHDTVYLSKGSRDAEKAEQVLIQLVNKYRPSAVAVGNGTGGRETEAFLRTLAKKKSWSFPIVSVSEAGASVYSASDIARKELPDVDLTIRGAVSIARRLQDPLAELVKIDPKAIGVGQYQHDLKPSLLADTLDAVVEDCVHRVGVDLATASAPLLARVSGIGPKTALSVVAYREKHGPPTSRRTLLEVKGIGTKAFELAAGFIRVQGGHPLDASALHPERYAVVERMAQDLGIGLKDMIGRADIIDSIDLNLYIEGELGLPTLRDIQSELKRPGRDPRAEFEAPRFSDDIQNLEDLQEGMTLEGIVTNVTSFGAFVDVGVHQDGLVHISEISDQWVSDPSQVVRVGMKMKVRVLSVDIKRRRVGLSAKL